MSERPSVDDRFWDKIMPEPNSGCWLFMGGWNSKNYGMFSSDIGRELAHRFAYRRFRGPIPADRQVLHKCDVRCCGNPHHLFLGTPADNTADMIAKGRQATDTGSPGELHPRAKLSDRKVILIRVLNRMGRPGVRIARLLDVHKATVYAVVNGRHWSHVVDPPWFNHPVREDIADRRKAGR